MVGIVTALYDIAPGLLLPHERLSTLKAEIEAAHLKFNVIESLPVSEDIKLGRSNRDELIDVYRQNVRRLGEIGIEVICYNFMPLFDWYRTDLAFELPDGSNAMSYDHNQLDDTPDPWEANLPAYFPLGASPDAIKDAYRAIGEDDLRANLKYFLEGVCPAAEAVGIKMAIHPDDPPWSIFDLPRIVKNEMDLANILAMVDSPANGLTFCTGSLGANPENDLPTMIRRFGERIYFAHCRNIKITGEKQFHETAHPARYGHIDMTAVMQAYADIDFSGPMRPDHGRMIWGESGIPGYGLYDRALGATYLLGLWDGLTANRR